MTARTIPDAQQLEANLKFSRACDKQATADLALSRDATEDNEVASMDARLAMLAARRDAARTNTPG
jgi:hypothetical protein